jgi:integrase
LATLAKPLHPLPVVSIDRRAIASLLSAVGEASGPSAASNLHSSLSGYFRWLVGEGLIDVNPLLHANRPKAGAPRDRILSEDELRTLWASLADDDYGTIVRLLVYTGARRAEIGDLCWSEVDLDAAEIKLPASRMKNGRPHLIPLSPPALALLRARERNGRDRVFGDGPRGFQNWSRGRRALDAAIGGERPTWTLHDLRRLVSTTMHERLNIQPHVVEAVLAHVGHRSGVAGVYNLATYAHEKRRALARWADYVDAVVTGKPAQGEVVHLHGQRG